MRIMIVDDNREDLELLSDMVWELRQDDDIVEFENPLEALAQAREEEFDIAFIDILMPELSGMDLGRYLLELNPYINLIFYSGHTEFGYEALRIHASGYIAKPCNASDVKNELSSLRNAEPKKRFKRVYAQTFGNFELFVDDKPVEFKYSRTKEIVALLINNKGAQTTNGEIVAALWEDEGDTIKKQSYLSNLRQDLQNTFKKLKIDDIIIKRRGSMAIARDRIDCDLYDWLENRHSSRFEYTGDYMNQYSWAEYYHAELDELLDNY
ncbi:MAG: response regulator [Lachnospiraceae bacterium]|nr:response regulator [Lachnospiraceae bacterium]